MSTFQICCSDQSSVNKLSKLGYENEIVKSRKSVNDYFLPKKKQSIHEANEEIFETGLNTMTWHGEVDTLFVRAPWLAPPSNCV